jgi:hypothetical protein
VKNRQPNVVWAGFSQKGPKGAEFSNFLLSLFSSYEKPNLLQTLNRILFEKKKVEKRNVILTMKPNSSLGVRFFWSVLAVLS